MPISGANSGPQWPDRQLANGVEKSGKSMSLEDIASKMESLDRELNLYSSMFTGISPTSASLDKATSMLLSDETLPRLISTSSEHGIRSKKTQEGKRYLEAHGLGENLDAELKVQNGLRSGSIAFAATGDSPSTEAVAKGMRESGLQQKKVTTVSSFEEGMANVKSLFEKMLGNDGGVS